MPKNGILHMDLERGWDMLDTGRIASIIAADKYSRRKRQARLGQRYYDGKHDILEYKIYYITKEGKVVEDLTRATSASPIPSSMRSRSRKFLISCQTEYSLKQTWRNLKNP